MICRARPSCNPLRGRALMGAHRKRAVVTTPDSGIYCLWICLQRSARIRVGRLGRFLFPPGYYAYVGSAQRGLRARIARHCRRKKRLHWHVDFLLTRARIMRVIVLRGARLDECRLAAGLGKQQGAKCLIPRFGASDCRCATHLWLFGGHTPDTCFAPEKRLTIRPVCGKMATISRRARNRVGGGIAHGEKA